MACLLSWFVFKYNFLPCYTQGEKTDYSVKIQELQKQLAMDAEEAEKLQVLRI